MCDASDRLKSSGWDESLFRSLLFCDCFEIGIHRVFTTHTIPRNYSIGPYDVLQQTPIAREHQSHFGSKRMWEERRSVGRVRHSLGTLLKIFCSTFFTGYPFQKPTLMFENRVSSLFQLFICVGMFLYWFIKFFTEVDHWNPDEFVGP